MRSLRKVILSYADANFRFLHVGMSVGISHKIGERTTRQGQRKSKKKTKTKQSSMHLCALYMCAPVGECMSVCANEQCMHVEA